MEREGERPPSVTPRRRAWRASGAARVFVLCVLAALLGAWWAVPAGAAPASAEPTAFILVDADTGAVLAAKQSHQPLPPASTVKLWTALSALHRLPSDATVPVSERAAAMPAMKINMRAGDVWPLNDALHSLLMVSANDAAYAIAERAGGSIEQFATLANEYGKHLGVRDSTFRDPSGLDDEASFGGGSEVSAFDLAVIARNVLALPALAQIVRTLDYEFTDPAGAGRSLTNHNRGLLTTYAGATGMKTGLTDRAGRTLVASATRDGRTFIAVVMGTWDDTGWAGYLLDQGFATPRGTPAPGEVLPRVRATTADMRIRAYEGLPSALGRSAPGATATPEALEASTASSPPTPAATVAPEADAEASRSTDQATSASDSTNDAASDADAGRGIGLLRIFSVRNAVLVALALLLTVFLLRRRAVRRQRARRIAHQRALAEKRRRRMIDVVEDAPPVAASVRLVRAEAGRR